MKFYASSFALGLASAAALLGARRHLRPVTIELGALAVHLGRVALALIERQREHAEDLWAEVLETSRRRAAHRPAAPPRDAAVAQGAAS